MTRLLATGDLHIGLKRFGRTGPDGVNSRVRDFVATLERLVDVAIADKVDFLALLGDNFHTRTPGPREMTLFTEQVAGAADAGIVVLIPLPATMTARRSSATRRATHWRGCGRRRCPAYTS